MSIETFFLSRHGGDISKFAGYASICWRYRYFSPEIHYEYTMSKLVRPDSVWLDVGGGRDVFPSNRRLARELADRCRLLVGVDPSENIAQNEFVGDRACCLLEDYQSTHHFDIASMRMVAEHIEDPDRTVAVLARLVRPGGRVVVYTVNKRTPSALVAASTPMSIHHNAKKFLWNSEERDTFPVFYRMNTRKSLSGVFQRHGFREEHFEYLDDCRSLTRWQTTFRAEILIGKLFRSVGLSYPENCLLGIYSREDPASK